jgi:hypothetical protein
MEFKAVVNVNSEKLNNFVQRIEEWDDVVLSSGWTRFVKTISSHDKVD